MFTLNLLQEQEEPMPVLKHPPEMSEQGEPLIDVRFKITRSQRKYLKLHQYQNEFSDKHTAMRDILQCFISEHPQKYERRGRTNE